MVRERSRVQSSLAAPFKLLKSLNLLANQDYSSIESSEVTVSDMNQMFGPGREKALLRVASGQSSDEETQALVGWAIEQMRERGAAAVPSGSPFWRTLATLTGSRAFRL